MSYRVVAHHVISYRIISHDTISNQRTSYQTMANHAMSCHLVPHYVMLPGHIMPQYLTTSNEAKPKQAKHTCHLMPSHLMQYHTIQSHLVSSHRVLSHLLASDSNQVTPTPIKSKSNQHPLKLTPSKPNQTSTRSVMAACHAMRHVISCHTPCSIVFFHAALRPQGCRCA